MACYFENGMNGGGTFPSNTGSFPPNPGGFYHHFQRPAEIDVSQELLSIEMLLLSQLRTLSFPHPVACIYSPLEYAYETHVEYVRRFCKTTKPILFVGMNPGPFGMAQTGIPFGDATVVKEWLQITGNIGKPPVEHPKRMIQGLNCHRNEVSGQRFWGFFQDICEVPERFFQHAFVYNYCPLMFMKDTAKNITPNELKSECLKALQYFCDEALFRVIQLLQVKMIIAVGRYAEKRVKTVVELTRLYGVDVRYLIHPSPINPAANQGWKDQAMQLLQEARILHLFSMK